MKNLICLHLDLKPLNNIRVRVAGGYLKKILLIYITLKLKDGLNISQIKNKSKGLRNDTKTI